jgi:hypothetical protein
MDKTRQIIMNIKKTLLCCMVSGLMSTSAYSAPITVGGITWDPDAFTDLTIASQLFESFVSTARNTAGPDGIPGNADDGIGAAGSGDILGGIGLVDAINGVAFCASCELTFEFGGFELLYATPTLADPLITDFVFTDGWVNFYADTTPNWGAVTPGVGTIAEATDGLLWLSLTAHVNKEGLTLGTIFGSATGFGVGSDDGEGSGLLDVAYIGNLGNPETALGFEGAANANVDTNGKSDALGGFADFNFTSSFEPLNALTPTDGFGLVGTAQFRGDSIAVPEPSAIALLSLGLLGLVGASRKRKAK